MTPIDILRKTCAAIDLIIAAAENHGDLFPSILTLSGEGLPDDRPPAIEGQREHDRAWQGANLMHDHVLLRAMYDLGPRVNRESYEGAANRYLLTFAHQCTDTPTGLFPWGEHAYWHLTEQRVGDSKDNDPPVPIHDHLRQAPPWLWERLWEYNSECVEQFCAGLEWHWTTSQDGNYNRHAPILGGERIGHTKRSCDFPRHSGFYICDLCFAYAKTGRNDYRQQIDKLHDYWWERRWDNDTLASESRTPRNDTKHYKVMQTGQTLSLAVSLLEAADLIQTVAADLADTMRQRANAYLTGALSMPHDLDKGVVAQSVKQRSGDIVSKNTIWGGVYGNSAAATTGLTALRAAILTDRRDMLVFAMAIATLYEKKPIPKRRKVRARDAAQALQLLTNLFDLTSQQRWADAADRLARQVMEQLFDHPLPRCATGSRWYENQLGTTYLLHALARYALLVDRDLPSTIEPDYTDR